MEARGAGPGAGKGPEKSGQDFPGGFSGPRGEDLVAELSRAVRGAGNLNLADSAGTGLRILGVFFLFSNQIWSFLERTFEFFLNIEVDSQFWSNRSLRNNFFSFFVHW